MKKTLFTAGGILLLVYGALILSIFTEQRRFIYHPDSSNFSTCPSFQDSQQLNINGTRFYYKHTSDKLMVFYHGNAGSACDRSFLKNEFEKQGYSYIFVEYAGYASDRQAPTEANLLRDVTNINAFVQTLHPTQLVIMGESLGTALGAYHSSLIGGGNLLLVSPFDTMLHVAGEHFPLFPVSIILQDQYDSVDWANTAKRVLIIHGSVDSLIPLRLGRHLFESLPTKDKSFLEISSAGHGDVYQSQEALAAIDDFLK